MRCCVSGHPARIKPWPTVAATSPQFAFFVGHIQRMDALFEASFSPLASSGKVLSKCGK